MRSSTPAAHRRRRRFWSAPGAIACFTSATRGRFSSRARAVPCVACSIWDKGRTGCGHRTKCPYRPETPKAAGKPAGRSDSFDTLRGRHVDAEICAGYATGAAKAQLAAQLAGERREHLQPKPGVEAGSNSAGNPVPSSVTVSTYPSDPSRISERLVAQSSFGVDGRIVFAATYLFAASIYWVVTRLAVNDRTRAFKAVSPGMLHHWAYFSPCWLASSPSRSG